MTSRDRYNAARRQARAAKKALAKRDALATQPQNLKLVKSIAERVIVTLPIQFDLDDLIAVGNIALLNAASVYDPDANGGTPFSAFARQKIRGAVIESVRRNRYVENTRESIDAIPGPRGEHRWTIDGDANVPSHVHQAFARLAHHPTAPVAIDRAKRNRRVSDAIAWLPAPEREVLAAVYDGSGLEIAAAGRLLGISRTKASRLHASAIASLRARLHPGSPMERKLPKAA